MAFVQKVHPIFNKCRIVVKAGAHRESYTMVPTDIGELKSTSGNVRVYLDTEDDLPCRVLGVFVNGKVTEEYSIIPNGGKTRSRFART